MPQKTSIIEIIKQQIQKEDSLPVLSPKAMKIQGEATKNDPDFNVLARMIRLDPTLTSQILKTANSPFYRGLGDVDTIKDAIIRLGQNEMINIIMKVVHQQNFKSNNPLIRSYQSRLWNHSVSCAIGTLWTAKYLSLGELIPKAFIAGLLHDMGKLYLLTALEKILESETAAFKPPPQLIEKILDSLHSVLGYSLLTKWHLPERYRIIARDHHATEYNYSDLLLLIVRLVNAVCKKMEKNDPGADLAGIVSSKEADILGMPEIGVAELEIALEDARTNRPM
ncbi:MAG: HDOD domain-containing protein [Proteobacteria bacterium]|nr:HDOD domain-containing protein [Desulfobacula sp.]MBU3951216.1 HDOD domain-containing protein [Pseudomonadota bacterium]MBU4133628.1 HDOD domain-containing protein [Pseudomonadota bacterium]